MRNQRTTQFAVSWGKRGKPGDWLNQSLSFSDYYGNEVRLALGSRPFSNQPRHVWVICRFHKQWLLTRHKRRGLEFPGGKIEPGETAEQAACREVYEETGAHVATLYGLGQYQVIGRNESIEKNIYFAEIDTISVKEDYLETDGPFLLNKFPEYLEKDRRFSFLMKDKVLTASMHAAREAFWIDRYRNSTEIQPGPT
ncbi:8-oxo-dGTP diphosphatase [Sporolactobacillus spathodeae]|uniref:8-oxo-dGTP diphosphatase n=1 Tax=Sporolactobacillus spathodeae TaxID=1465502 RepID=A0ABS2Q9M0_9BACL|nr:8-oxo-dGTP diphosphatase [Sporolactobacillus spathodeae]